MRAPSRRDWRFSVQIVTDFNENSPTAHITFGIANSFKIKKTTKNTHHLLTIHSPEQDFRIL